MKRSYEVVFDLYQILVIPVTLNNLEGRLHYDPFKYLGKYGLY